MSSCTPLFAAAWQGHVAAIKMMLEMGADPNRGDSEKRTPLEVCVCLSVCILDFMGFYVMKMNHFVRAIKVFSFLALTS